eukprot:scaffold21229_cov63-Phaeocystis_antarctica.AAC.1
MVKAAPRQRPSCAWRLWGRALAHNPLGSAPWRCPSSAPLPSQGAPGGSRQLGTPAVVCRRGCTYGSREKRAAIQEYEDKNMKTMAFSCRVILTRLQRARQQFS